MSDTLTEASPAAKYAAKFRDDYRDLVLRVSRGEEPKPAEVAKVLSVVGRSPSEFERDVSLIIQRVAWVEKIEAEEAAQGKLAELQAEIATATDALDQLRKDFEEKLLAASEAKRAALDEAIAFQNAISSVKAKSDLKRTADRALVDRGRELAAKISKIEHGQLAGDTADLDALRAEEADVQAKLLDPAYGDFEGME